MSEWTHAACTGSCRQPKVLAGLENMMAKLHRLNISGRCGAAVAENMSMTSQGHVYHVKCAAGGHQHLHVAPQHAVSPPPAPCNEAAAVAMAVPLED